MQRPLVMGHLPVSSNSLSCQTNDTQSTGVKRQSVMERPVKKPKFNPDESVPENLKHQLPKQMFRPVGGRGALCLDQAVPLVHTILEAGEGDQENGSTGDSGTIVGAVTDAQPIKVNPIETKLSKVKENMKYDDDMALKLAHTTKTDGREQKRPQ